MTERQDQDDLAEQLIVEFRDDVQDRLGGIYAALGSVAEGQISATDALRDLRREIHSLKGAGTSYGYPIISLIAQRMDTFVQGLKDLDSKQIGQLHVFADRIAEMAERLALPDVTETNQIIRALPVRYEFDITDVEVRDVEVLLVTPNKLVARRVTTELGACGFKVNTVSDPIEAIGIAVRMPPDMVIASAVMDGLGGVDLIRGLHAISVTETVPMALLTSLDADSLKGMPPGTAVVRLGPSFQDDIAAAITQANLG
ncbi:Hpt domain-containing protein [Oleisolibacter albus]|uniref:Hpt domain-containing protein n=1 Tax=Oleisolibacter albus TaxID=2171757 RepID=UPI000DF29652|nr:Hpt domain-containing protein [Oleisolibacter albus]